MSEISRYVVKLARGNWSTLLKIGTQEECEQYAQELNAQYQTDEYRVEPWMEGVK